MKKTKLPNQWKFFLLIVALYGGTFFVDADFVRSAFFDFWETLKKVLPILGIVFFIMFLINLFLKPEAIKKHLGHDSGVKGWFYALAGSIAISGPPYILMPMIGEFCKQGMKISLAAVFLSNRSVQPVLLPVMAHYFGWTYALLVSFCILIFSILNGLIIEKVFIKSEKLSAKNRRRCFKKNERMVRR